MEYSEALAHKIEARITELKTEIDAHERALAALRGRSGAASSNATASNGRRRGAAKRTRAAATKSDGATAKSAGAGNGDGTAAGRPRRARSRSASASAEAVFDALKEGQDQASAIAKQFGVSPAVVRNRLSQLEEAGRVSRTGNRRSTRWRSHAA
jgi:predicted Rossmann fold nucleotide-binding protein DprA/Smf involved in DNA uptake